MLHETAALDSLKMSQVEDIRYVTKQTFEPKIVNIYAPHDNGWGIKCYPCPYVRNYVRLSRRCPLSNSNIFYQNFMNFGHIVKYHDVFFKFDNGPYRTRLSRVMALCL